MGLTMAVEGVIRGRAVISHFTGVEQSQSASLVGQTAGGVIGTTQEGKFSPNKVFVLACLPTLWSSPVVALGR